MPFALQSMMNGGYGSQPWQTFNAWWPSAAGRYRVFVFIHPSAWSMATKDEGNALCQSLAAKGAVAFTLDYKLATPTEPSWPQCSDDLLVFDAWLRGCNFACADLSNVTYYGVSSGGHIALISSCRGLAPTRVVSNCGPLDLRAPYPTPLEPYVAQFIGGGSRIEASPTLNVVAKSPGTRWILFQGADDPLVYPAHIDALAGVALTAKLPGVHDLSDWPVVALNWTEVLWQLSK